MAISSGGSAMRGYVAPICLEDIALRAMSTFSQGDRFARKGSWVCFE